MITRFIEYASDTEHAGLTVVRCTVRGCNAFCCALAPRVSDDGLPVCGFHDVCRDTYHAPSGLTKTRRISWLMYHGLLNTGPCWLCRVPVPFVNFEAAHVKPRSISKNDSVANLRPCCITCNKNCGTDNLLEFAARRDVINLRSTDERAAAETLMMSEDEATKLFKRFTSKLAKRSQNFPPNLQAQLKTHEAAFAVNAAAAAATADPGPSPPSSSSSSSSSSLPLYTIFRRQ